jgi:predicted MFS family arabinose efflux permease
VFFDQRRIDGGLAHGSDLSWHLHAARHEQVALLGVIVFFLQIDTLPQKNSSRDKHLQNRLSETPCAFGAD